MTARGSWLVSQCASEITLQPIEWLWPGRIAKGKHTCIAGEPGTGKSQLTMSIVATVTMGREWPCGEGRSPQGSVIILSAEDGAADTIVPRLHAAEADCGGVHIVSAVRDPESNGRRSFSLQKDLELLEREIDRLGDVALVVIDPVSSYLGGKTDSHKNAEVRGVLEPIGEMAERLNVAVLSVTHFSKAGASTSTKAIHRFIGSIAFVGAPRTAFVVLDDEEDDRRRLFLHAKNNLAPPPQGLAFGMEETVVGDVDQGIVASRIRWEKDPVSITANEAMAETGSSNRPASEEAEEFLLELLADGPVPAKQVKSDSDAAGITWATIRRVKSKLGIKVKREGFGPGSTVHWVMPAPIGAQNSIDAHVNKVSTYGESEHLCSQNGSAEEPDDFPDLPPFLDRRTSEGA